MQLQRGCVVRALSGRDKDLFFTVLEVRGREVFLCNGDGRPLERPKRKNIIHIAMTNYKLEEQMMVTNRKIRRALAEIGLRGNKGI